MPTLLFYYPEKEKRWKLEVQADRFTIGRSREAEVCIPHTSVSKKHLLVERRGPKYIFRDLGSKNGSYLNDFRMARGSLSDGDELRVGSIRITFYKAGAPDGASGRAVSEPARAGTRPGDAGVASAGLAGTPRAEQETAALPRRQLSDRLEEPGEAASIEEDPETIDLIDEDMDPDGEDPEPPRPGRKPSRGPFEERLGVPGDLFAAHRGERRLSPVLLAGGALACVGLGIVLGYVGASLGKREATPDPAGTTVPAPGVPGGASGSGAPEARSGAAAITVPADISEPATRRRLIVRLHIDLLGRSPTREELASLEKLSREEIWVEIARRAERMTGAERGPETPEAVFSRFLGRSPSPEEVGAVVEAARGSDPDHFAAVVGTSAFYASSQHRRKRTETMMARSLFTDLVGYPPGRTEEETVLAALRNPKNGPAAVARTLADSPNSLAGPRPAEPVEAWLEDAYARLLLRPPTAEERQGGIGAGREGWRGLLAGIASGREYGNY